MVEQLLVSQKEIEPSQRVLRIGVMGAMASGKSTLASLLGEKWKVNPIEERFENNPYLKTFYANPEEAGISLKTQMQFLGLKTEQMMPSKKEVGESSINSDKPALPQVEIFVPPIEMDALYGQVQAEMGLMTTREYDIYKMMYEISKENMIVPIDLYVFVDAPDKVLLERILDERKRKLEHPEFFENYPDYLPKLVGAARKWQIEATPKHPVVLVDSVNNNFADNTMERENICVEIESKIKKFLNHNPYANENTEIPHGRDGAQIIVPDFLKTR